MRQARRPLKPLGLGDVPPARAKGDQAAGKPAFRIRDKVPAGYTVDKTPLGEGAHNAAFKATHPGIREAVLFRVNTDEAETQEEHHELDREVAEEVTRNIEFAVQDIAPLLYDYGYCPKSALRNGYYWQVMELYDESLYAYFERRGTHWCKSKSRVEELVLDKLSSMVKAGAFCYDIHPRNVVVRTDPVRPGRLVKVALIDFDDSFCIRKSRLQPPAARARADAEGAPRRGRHPTYFISPNNLLVCALVVFGVNSKVLCGVPLFRDQALSLLNGDLKYAIPGGGPVDLHSVLHFLAHSTAQGRDSVLGIMRHWNQTYGKEATAEEFLAHVLGTRA